MGMLKGKNAIVTGARRGIGKATVETFAREGASVWACARTEDAAFEQWAKDLEETHKINIWIQYFDLTDPDSTADAVKQMRAKKLSIDILVNNAGMVPNSTSFLMTPVDKMKEVFDINFFSQMRFTQYVARIMDRQKSGCVVNVSSVAGLDGSPGQLEYSTSKAALALSTRKLAGELSQSNIRVNAVAPGIVDTDMGSQVKESLKQKVLLNSALGRIGQSQEIAEAIAFLASDRASYITGQILRIDGGGLINA